MDGWWLVSYVVLWALVLALAALVVGLARQIGSLHLRLGPRGALELDDEGPPLGSIPEAADLEAADGDRLTVGGPGAAEFLLFVSLDCTICEQVLPAVGALASEGSFAPRVVVDGSGEEAEMLAARRRLRAPVLASPELARGYGVPGTPYAVVLDELGVVRAKGTVNNLEQVEGLVRTADARTERDLEEASAA
jgi:methylamine dehydrogenase accessory protein MauD